MHVETWCYDRWYVDINQTSLSKINDVCMKSCVESYLQLADDRRDAWTIELPSFNMHNICVYCIAELAIRSKIAGQAEILCAIFPLTLWYPLEFPCWLVLTGSECSGVWRKKTFKVCMCLSGESKHWCSLLQLAFNTVIKQHDWGFKFYYKTHYEYTRKIQRIIKSVTYYYMR